MQHLLAPRVVALERVGVRHLLRVGQRRTGDEIVRRLLDTSAARRDRRRRSSPFARPRDLLSAHSSRCTGCPIVDLRVAALLVVLAGRRERSAACSCRSCDLRRRAEQGADRAPPPKPPRPPPSTTATFSWRSDRPSNLRVPRVRRTGFEPSTIHLPEIEAIVDDRRLLARRESGRRHTRDAPAPDDRLRCSRTLLLILPVRFDARAVREVERPPLAVLLVHRDACHSGSAWRRTATW